MTNIDEKGQDFLSELFRQTEGNASAQVSMYKVGEALGMDKSEASRAAEMLMSWGLTEVRTLSGGIGITAEGLEKARELGGVGAGGGISALGNEPVLNDAAREGVDQVLAKLKAHMGELGLGFDLLGEMMADLKTAEAQLASPKPKTAILRECFRSVKSLLENAGAKEMLVHVKTMLGE